jgi:hypothetical protein
MSRIGLPRPSGVGASLPNPTGQSSCAAVPVSIARAGRAGATAPNPAGPGCPQSKARSAQNALKYGLRAQKFVLLPDEDAAEFAALDGAIIEELARAARIDLGGRCWEPGAGRAADRARAARRRRRLAPRAGRSH